MHREHLHGWEHEHTFGADEVPPGEGRTRWVVALTFAMMLVEIGAGLAFGSMALLADGWHMATHAAALGMAAFTYAYARRHANDRRFTFGTGKVSALGGFASAVSLAVVAVLVFAESVGRLVTPVSVRFDEAIGVAVVGLVVNLVSAYLLHERHDHGGHDGHRDHAGHVHHDHDGHVHQDHEDHRHHEHDGHVHHDHDDRRRQGQDGHVHHDHNLRGAYLHVLADAMTSVLAIGALVTGKFLGWAWTDAVAGLLGAALIARWSVGLVRDTSAVLLDAEASDARHAEIRSALEGDADNNRVADLHVWRVGRRHLAVIVSIVTDEPREPEHYKKLLARFGDLAHVTVEVHRCAAANP